MTTTPVVESSSARRDSLVLATLVLIAVIVYMPWLGFSSDDWSFFGNLPLAGPSFVDQYRSMGDVRMRPVQGALLAGIYHLFGVSPLPFHIVNTAALIAGVILFYLVLLELGLTRTIAFATALLYGLLPHYSADRFWVAAIQATVSMPLYFGTLLAELRAVRDPKARWRWWSVAAVTRILCILSYEVFLPLLLLNPLIAWFAARRRHSPPRDWYLRGSGLVIAMGIALATLAPALAYKASVTSRLGGSTSWQDHLSWLAWIYRGAAWLATAKLGLLLPRSAWRLWRAFPSVPALIVAVVTGVVTFAYLRKVARHDRPLPDWRASLRLIGVGVLVFIAGYAVFLITKNASNTATGIGNRIAIAAAVGVAVIWTAGAALLSRVWKAQSIRADFFSGLTAALFAISVFINASLGALWVEAYRKERSVIAAIERQFPTFPGPMTLIVDGVCPYVGPAIVFDSSWDLLGALQSTYRARGIQADIITPSMTVTDSGLVASLYYGAIVTHYPYDRLSMFHVPSGKLVPIENAAAARRYLEQFNPDRGAKCGPTVPGEGVRVF